MARSPRAISARRLTSPLLPAALAAALLLLGGAWQAAHAEPAGACVAAAAVSADAVSADAVSALQNLGFKPAVAAQAVARAQEELGEGAAEGDLIRVALKKAAG